MPDRSHRDHEADCAVVEYLFELDASRLYSPRIRARFGEKVFTLVDWQPRKYPELNGALKANLDMAQRWQQRFAPGHPMIVSSHDLRRRPTGSNVRRLVLPF